MLNVALTQLHPHSWDFVWVFKVLSKFLGRETNMRVFFSFFQSKGVSKSSWVSLSRLLRRKLLKAFNSSYKNFKVGYFKVVFWQDVFAFFQDKNAIVKFSLCWSMESSSIIGVEYQSLSLEDQLTIDLLEDCPVSESSTLVKYGNDPEGLTAYMGWFLFCLSFFVYPLLLLIQFVFCFK